MGLVVVTSALDEAELVERVRGVAGLEVVETGHEFWPRAVRSTAEVHVKERDGSQVAFKPQASLEGNMLHFWGLNLKSEAFEAVMGPLRRSGVRAVDSF